MTLLISQPPRVDLCEITTDQTGKLRAKITRPWSMYLEAIFARVGGNVASTPDDIEQGQLARVQDNVVSLETSLSIISTESQRVASELDALRAQPNPASQLASELDALLSQPTPSSLSFSLPSGHVPYGAGLGTTVASSANFTYNSVTNTLSTGNITGSALTMAVQTKSPSGVGSFLDSLSNTVFSWTDTGAVSKLAFFGATRVVQPAAYTLTYSTAVRTVPAATAANVVTTPATLVAYGFTQAQADSIPVEINAMQADMLELKKLIVSLINDLSTTSGVGLNAT